jgi:hypothetical protein
VSSSQESPPVAGDEIVMRRVPDSQTTTDTPPNGPKRPSTQAFKQDGADGPASVYLLSKTTPEAVLGDRLETYVAMVSVSALRAEGLDVIRSCIEGDPGHCDITGHRTNGMLKRIARNSEWVPSFGPPIPEDPN